MKLEMNSSLHVVDKDTKFGVACFLNGESVAETWAGFMLIFVSKYVGLPDKVAVSQRPQFASVE